MENKTIFFGLNQTQKDLFVFHLAFHSFKSPVQLRNGVYCIVCSHKMFYPLIFLPGWPSSTLRPTSTCSRGRWTILRRAENTLLKLFGTSEYWNRRYKNLTDLRCISLWKIDDMSCVSLFIFDDGYAFHCLHTICDGCLIGMKDWSRLWNQFYPTY